MNAQVPRRRGRTGRWAAPALVTVLVALLHLFGCAHGPGVSGAAGVDSLAAAAPAAPAAAPGTVRAAGSGEGTQCPGSDEPSRVQQDRGGDPALPAARPGDGPDGAAAARVGRPPVRTDGRRAPPGGCRAVLGVWRV
ncbi:hypothetical protein [Streptomyces subrutilus]|uniref:hypothetical protein n=1 Tax=Streptomyces subrutilus TaxID=36818 RepID=UPI0033F9E60A